MLSLARFFSFSLLFLVSENLGAVCDTEAQGCKSACTLDKKSQDCGGVVSSLRQCLKSAVTNSALKISLAAMEKVADESAACINLGEIALDAENIDITQCKAMKCEGSGPAKSITDCWESKARALKKILHREIFRKPAPRQFVLDHLKSQEKLVEQLLSLFYGSSTCERLNKAATQYEKKVQ